MFLGHELWCEIGIYPYPKLWYILVLNFKNVKIYTIGKKGLGTPRAL